MPGPGLDALFAALADPTRRAILARLAHGERAVSELAEPFSISAPAITRHLKVLERAGLVTRSRAAQRRPCRLDAAPLREVAAWLAPYRRHWERRPGTVSKAAAPVAPRAPARAAARLSRRSRASRGRGAR